MTFFVTILGSGAATPTLGRHCSAQSLNIFGQHILVDCGEATQIQIRAYRQRLQSFSLIVISHLHGDHVFGLPGLLSSMHLCGRKEPVQVVAPAGLKSAMEHLLEMSGTQLQFETHFTELDTDRPQVVYDGDRCKVTAFPLVHTVPTYGYIFEEKLLQPHLVPDAVERYGLTPDECRRIKAGEDLIREGVVVPRATLVLPQRKARRYAYCCDTAYTETILPYIRDVDLLCMESTFSDDRAALAEDKCHCTAAQAAQLAAKANARQLLLTHFSARYRNVEPLLAEARAHFDNVVSAVDGAVIDIPVRDHKASCQASQANLRGVAMASATPRDEQKLAQADDEVPVADDLSR